MLKKLLYFVILTVAVGASAAADETNTFTYEDPQMRYVGRVYEMGYQSPTQLLEVGFYISPDGSEMKGVTASSAVLEFARLEDNQAYITWDSMTADGFKSGTIWKIENSQSSKAFRQLTALAE